MPQVSLNQRPLETRLPLSKFSHSTTPLAQNGPLVWTHIKGDENMACIFEKYSGDMASSKLILKVIQRRAVLEQIDIEHFIRSINMQQALVQSTSPSKPSAFAVVVKAPCLAVKYPQGENQVRRFQLKFAQDQDYYTALSILSGINCPLTESSISSPRAVRRLPSSSSLASVPSVHLSTIASREEGSTITSDSNVPGPFYSISRTTSDVERIPSTLSSATGNLHNSASGKAQLPPSQDQGPKYSHSPTMEKHQSEYSRPQPSSSRTTAAPVFHDQQLNQMLPPKRDLPFLKPNQKTRADSLSQNSSQQKVLESSIAEQPAVERHDSLMSDFSSAPLTSTQPYPETTQTDVFAPDLQGTQPFPFSNATSTQVAPELLVPASQTGLSYNEAIHSSQAQQSTEHTADISVEDQLSLYLASPTEERIAFLENWMCELIEDEQFMTLCQDVEGTWKRFAFGIKH